MGSLGSLFLAVSIISVISAWLGFLVREADRQRDAVSAIRSAGAIVHYDYQVAAIEPYSYDAHAEPPGPRWLHERLGVDFFADVVTVVGLDRARRDEDLNRIQPRLLGLAVLGPERDLCFGDAHGALLSSLPKLRYLDLSYMPITDVGLSHLWSVRRLEWLDLRRTQATKQVLAQVARLPELRVLRLDCSVVTTSGLRDLTGLPLQRLELAPSGGTAARLYPDSPPLRRADLDGSTIDDDALLCISAMRGLRELSVYGALVTDVGVSRLAQLTELRSLTIYGATITDQSVVDLLALQKLEDLKLIPTKITNEGLLRLSALPTLRSVSVCGPRITSSGVAAFRKATPTCECSLIEPTPWW